MTTRFFVQIVDARQTEAIADKYLHKPVSPLKSVVETVKTVVVAVKITFFIYFI